MAQTMLTQGKVGAALKKSRARRNELQPILIPKGVAMLASVIPPPVFDLIIKKLKLLKIKIIHIFI